MAGQPDALDRYLANQGQLGGSLAASADTVPFLIDPAAPGLRVRLAALPGLTKEGLFDDYGDAGFLFQVPPIEEFAREYGYEFTDYTAIDKHTYSRPVAESLTTVTFPTLFIDDAYAWTLMRPNPSSVGRLPDPVKLAHDLVAICRSGTPFKLTASQPQLWSGEPEFSMRCTLRSLRVAERPGEIDARYIDVTFTQWNSLDPLSSEKQGASTPNRKVPARVTVNKNGSVSISPQVAHPQWGDNTTAGVVTLHKLAKFFYGSYTQWTLIAKKNGMTTAVPSDSLYSQWTKGKHHGPVIIPVPPSGS